VWKEPADKDTRKEQTSKNCGKVCLVYIGGTVK
jgi:hypothetical protein